MKILMFLLIPLFLFAQTEYQPSYGIPFTSADTLFGADSLTSGWLFIGDKLGSQTFGIVFDPLGDASVDVSGVLFDGQIKLEGFPAGAFDDSVSAGGGTGWMHLATIDSTFIADSLGWYYPLAAESWWNWVDWIRFRLRNATAADTFKVTISRLRGQ